MRESRNLIKALRYYRQVLSEFNKGLRASFRRLQMLIGILITLAILYAQIRLGLVPQQLVWPQLLSFSLPYVVLIVVTVVFHGLRAPWKVDERRKHELAESRTEYETVLSERDVLIEQERLRNVVPELHLDLDEVHFLLGRYSADCFMQVTLHNKSATLARLRKCSATLRIGEKDYDGYRTDDLDGYIVTHNICLENEQFGVQWSPIPGADEALAAVPLLDPLSHDTPMIGWLHFRFPVLPHWPVRTSDEPTGNMIRMTDSETGEETWETEFKTHRSKERLMGGEVIVWDVYNRDWHFTVEKNQFDYHEPSRIIRPVRLPEIKPQILQVEKDSKLEITFKPNSEPFTQINNAADGSPLQKLYRVAVTSPVRAEVVLLVNNVRLGGAGPFFNIHLHVMHDTTGHLKRVKLYPDAPGYWDVILVGAETNSLHLYHIQENLAPELSPGSQEFQLLAVTDQGPPTAKTAVIDVGQDNSVLFRLRD